MPERKHNCFRQEISMIRLRMSSLAILLFALLPLYASFADETEALERLLIIITGLEELGDEMLGEPVTGSLALGDTTTLELSLSSEYMYYIHIWSDSYFNFMEFWLTDSRGEDHSIADGDYASLAAYPDTSGTWTLSIILHEGAYSDSASFAAAVFRGRRFL